MNRSIIIQIVSALILIALSIILINPFNIWMSSMMHMAVLGGAVVAFGALALFALAERGGDERDASHRLLAGRAAFLSGGAVLLFAITVQSMHHTLDSALVLALLAMVITKVSAHVYSSLYS